MRVSPLKVGLVGLLCALSMLAGGCSSERCSADGKCVTSRGDALRSITKDEALADYDQLTTSFRALYGAMTRKEQRYNFKFDDLVAQYRSQVNDASTEADYQGIFQEFVSRFQDPHISLTAPLISDASHEVGLPFLVMPVGDTWVVYLAAPNSGVNRGDELLALDGVPANILAAQLAKYAGVANPVSAKHMIGLTMTQRPTYLAQDIKAGQPAQLTVAGPDGAERSVTLKWKEAPRALPLPSVTPAPAAGASGLTSLVAHSATAAAVTKAELSQMGDATPFFMTDAVKAQLNLTPVTPSANALGKFNLTADAAAKVGYFAGTYALGDKKVLFIRLPSYAPDNADDAANYLRALLDEQEPQVDALIFDETHNPGGDLFFALQVASILAPQKFNSFVEEVHADRMWINSFVSASAQVKASANGQPDELAFADDLMKRAQLVDDAYSNNRPLSAPVPMFFNDTAFDPDTTHWTKPLLVLTDELSVSCADFVPLLVKANHMGTLFGARTMGGGGNVEKVATLTNTQADLEISRGLGTVFDPSGTYPEANFIEDNGVLPDVPYNHTLADFRAGYVGYVAAFNAQLARQLQ